MGRLTPTRRQRTLWSEATARPLNLPHQEREEEEGLPDCRSGDECCEWSEEERGREPAVDVDHVRTRTGDGPNLPRQRRHRRMLDLGGGGVRRVPYCLGA